MIAKLAGHHSGYVCCIEKSQALFKILLQLQDCVEQSELVTEELLINYEVRGRIFGFSDAADAFQGEESLYVCFKAAFNSINATEPLDEQA